MILVFLFKRLCGAAGVLLVVSFLTFALLNMAPGDAAQTLVGDYASASQLERVRQQMGLDAPVVVRYIHFVTAAVLHGDLGSSLISGRAVAGLVAERFAYTLALAVVSMALAVTLGTLAGLAAATRQGGALDLVLMTVTTLGQSLPTYWVALLLILVFSLWLRWLPVVGAGSPAHMVLPAVSLALPTTAVVARLTRASLLDVKGADYVCTARAKGIGPECLWRVHILRNGLIPVITLLGLHLGHILGGTFIIETIFGWPGLGRLVVQAVFDRDFPVVVGAVLLIAVIYQVINLAVDMAHAWLDPRVGFEAL